jgi:sugar phosphate isomerase/epimerase
MHENTTRQEKKAVTPTETKSLWAHENLVPYWVPIGTPRYQRETPEARALTLEKLGFRRLAYAWPGLQPFRFWWNHAPIPTLDQELETLRRHDIDLVATWFPFDPEDPAAEEMLKTLHRNDVHPQLWVMHSMKPYPSTRQGWDELFPEGEHVAESLATRIYEPSFARSPEEQERKLADETERIGGLAALAASYGCSVALYNHHGWFGMMENQVAILDRLEAAAAPPVGIAYSFSHARDRFYDHATDFAAIWASIERRVVAVNIGGTRHDGELTYPSQDDRELRMMRVIEASGWRGPVTLKGMHGMSTESFEITIRNFLLGVDWCARELEAPGSGGPRPFPAVSTS